MKVAGIICEYNPFHNGHAHHIRRTREITQCDAVVCVMSGSVVQRGGIAMQDKWTRARWALQNGADLVIELPAYYVLQSADTFARGGVTLLSALGASHISFGSESGDLAYLNRLADCMQYEGETFRAALSAALSGGMGYPAAYACALRETDPAFSNPPGANDLLGAAYLRALRECGGDMAPVAVERRGAGHDCSGEADGFASASQIRERLRYGQPVDHLVPWREQVRLRDINRLESLILGFFRMTSPEILRTVPGMEDGLENRLTAAARDAGTLEQFWDAAVTRRYTRSRVRRTILCALLGIRTDMTPECIRVLGFTPAGATLLRSTKDTSPLPQVVKMADFRFAPDGMTAADLRATDLSALCDNASAGADYTTSPVKWRF